MIATIAGQVLQVGSGLVVVNVGGVGFALRVTGRTSAVLRPRQKVFLHTTLVVRQDALELFAFASGAERTVFNLLTTISGVGPRVALAILDQLTPQQIALAVSAEDPKPFQQASGVGKKLAGTLVVQLAGRLPLAIAEGISSVSGENSLAEAAAGAATPGSGPSDSAAEENAGEKDVEEEPDMADYEQVGQQAQQRYVLHRQATEAIISLGWSKQQALDAVEKALLESTPGASKNSEQLPELSLLLKNTLALLSTVK